MQKRGARECVLGKEEVGVQRRCAYGDYGGHTGMGNERSSLTTGGTRCEGLEDGETVYVCIEIAKNQNWNRTVAIRQEHRGMTVR